MESTNKKIKQKYLAERFKALHHSGDTLIFVNVWDAVSAKMVENIGFPAIATSSASMAWSLGYNDGEKTPPELIIEAIRRITRVVQIPVTVDIEGGYFRDDLSAFGEFINQVIDAGAVGINLEDGYGHSERLNNLAYQCKEIEVAKKVGEENGINLFINARTDAMLLSKSTEEKIQICLEKAEAFQESGANGIFIPFINDMATVVALKQGIKLPLNVLYNQQLNVTKLKELGVERISTGARPFMSIMNKFNLIGESIKTTDNWSLLFEDFPTYDDLNNF